MSDTPEDAPGDDVPELGPDLADREESLNASEHRNIEDIPDDELDAMDIEVEDEA